MGLSSQQWLAAAATRAISPENLFSARSTAACLRASWSTNQKPALWRVSAYFGPGFPRPTTHRMADISHSSNEKRRHKRPPSRLRSAPLARGPAGHSLSPDSCSPLALGTSTGGASSSAASSSTEPRMTSMVTTMGSFSSSRCSLPTRLTPAGITTCDR